jgi:hypothetical protein
MEREQLITIIREIPQNNPLFTQAQKALLLLSTDDVIIQSDLESSFLVNHYLAIMEKRLANTNRNNAPTLGLPELVANLKSTSGRVNVCRVKTASDLIYCYTNEKQKILGLVIGNLYE